jgi:hypothetical protein
MSRPNAGSAGETQMTELDVTGRSYGALAAQRRHPMSGRPGVPVASLALLSGG